MKKIFKNVQYEKYYRDILPYLKKDKNQQYFTIILTLSASIFFALFAINPTLSTIAKLRKEVVDSKQVDEQLSQKINSLSSLSQAYQDIQTDIPFVLDAMPLQPEAPTLVAQIQSVAQNSDVLISSIKLAPVNLTDTIATSSALVEFDLSVKSNYDNLNKFIADLTGMQRIISIDSMSITKTEGTDQDLGVSIKGSAYYKK